MGLTLVSLSPRHDAAMGVRLCITARWHFEAECAGGQGVPV
jgi:hypothetical protein